MFRQQSSDYFSPLFCSRFCCLCYSFGVMFSGFSIVTFLVCTIFFKPHFVLSGISSWFCTPCAPCSSCPACQPRIEVAPHCEYRSNMNTCNCDCVSTTDFSKYHQFWAAQLVQTQGANHNAHMTVSLEKKQLLYWSFALLCIVFLLLCMIVALLFASPRLRRAYREWRSRSRQKRRHYLMKKHNLVARSGSTNAIATIDTAQLDRANRHTAKELSYNLELAPRHNQPL